MKVAKNRGQMYDWIDGMNLSLGTTRLLKVLMI